MNDNYTFLYLLWYRVALLQSKTIFAGYPRILEHHLKGDNEVSIRLTINITINYFINIILHTFHPTYLKKIDLLNN